MRSSHLLSRLLQLKHTINPHRNHWYSKISYQQSNAGTKGVHPTVCGVSSFGKNQDAVTAIHRLSRKRKALTKPGLAWEGKNIQQGNSQEPFHAIKNAQDEVPISRRRAQRLKRFATGSGREFVSDPARQSREYESDIDIIYVVGDDQYWALHFPKILPAFNFRPTQDEYRWTQKEIVHDKPHPG